MDSMRKADGCRGKPDSESARADCRNRRVLIVDDDTRITDLLAQMVEALGYAATVALTGEEALTKAASFHPDVVLLDLTMPGMTGAEMLDALKEASPHTPVLVMTGDPRRADGMIERGAAGYLAKPFGVDSLRQMLIAVLS